MKIFILSLLVIFGPAISQAEDLHLIMVNGIAEKSIEPNMMVMHFESWARANVAKKAQEIQASQYNKLKASLEKFKIKKEDIQTDSYNVNPDYVYDPKTRANRITGYRVSHSFSIIYRSVSTAGDFLDQIVTGESDLAGVSVTGVNWDSDKKAQTEIMLLADAVKSARDRATELAKAAGVTIKATHKIQNNTISVPVGQPVFEKAAGLMMSDQSAPTELSTGQIKVRVEVQMEFEI